MANYSKTPKEPRKAEPYFIYLASRSQRRIDYLKEMKIPFETVTSRYREHLRMKATPEALVLEHAAGKARKAVLPPLRRKPGMEFVLGADTLVFFKGRPLGKPATYREAEQTLARMSGKTNDVYTGLALIERRSGQMLLGFMKTRVRFKRWDAEKIKKYVRRVQALDKAGGYAIQSSPCIVAAYEGSLSNVVGLPKELLRRMIRRMLKLAEKRTGCSQEPEMNQPLICAQKRKKTK